MATISRYYNPKCPRCKQPIEVGQVIEGITLIMGKTSWVHVGCECAVNGQDESDYRPKSAYIAPKSKANSELKAVDNKTLAYHALGENWDWRTIDYIEFLQVIWIYDRSNPVPERHKEMDIMVYHMFNRATNRHMYVDKSGLLFEIDWKYMGRTDGEIPTVVELGMEAFQPMEVK